MGYTLPTFNIVVEYRHWVGSGAWGPWVETPAQLKGVPRLASGGSLAGVPSPSPFLMLKLPAGTDIRDSPTLSIADQVRLPGWTGDPLSAQYVYDVSFGFPTEYRVCMLARSNLNGSVVARPPGQGAVPSG